MNKLINKYIKNETIAKFIDKYSLTNELENEFYRYLIYHLNQTEKYGADEDEEELLMKYTTLHIESIIKIQSRGYSFRWAKKYTLISQIEENLCPSAYAYCYTAKVDKAIAKRDLELYAKENNYDQYFIKHFEYLLDIDVVNVKPSVEQQAITYSKIYKEEIMSGQSETYANKYAELIAENDSKYKTNAINEASEYCRILDEGASLKFAEIYSNNMGEYFANHCNNYTESLDDYFANEERNRLKELYKNLW